MLDAFFVKETSHRQCHTCVSRVIIASTSACIFSANVEIRASTQLLNVVMKQGGTEIAGRAFALLCPCGKV